MDKQIAILDRGRDYYQKREFEKAEECLRQAVVHFGNYADVWNMLGVICHDKGDIDEAQQNFEQALEINPRYTEAALNLAVTYNEQGKYARAKEVHERACAIKPGTSQIEPFALGKITNMHAELGQAYAELKMTDRAIEQYRAALALSPDFVDIRTRFGQLLRDAGYMREAVVQFKLVLETRPNYVPALISLGTTYYALGEKLNAGIQWEKAVEIDPDNRTAGMYLRMIRQLQALEEAEEAGVHLEVEACPPPERPDATNGELQFTFDEDNDKK
ncbi:MAG TPA: tetratricopeptide repeat protein [Candidatus Hydrogenedentes bacterium]|nr:tetratricopeptide repeat protein [Candidatus Hydrogenedentota bacterium]